MGRHGQMKVILGVELNAGSYSLAMQMKRKGKQKRSRVRY
jgi:hypothetical protein